MSLIDVGGGAGRLAGRELPQRGSRSIDNDAAIASLFSPNVAVLLPILQRLGVPLLDVMRLNANAAANGTDFQSELLASGLVAEDRFFREIGREFHIDYFEQIDPRKLTVNDEDCLELLRNRGQYLRAGMIDRAGNARSIFVP